MAQEQTTRRTQEPVRRDYSREIRDLVFKWSRVCDQCRLRDNTATFDRSKNAITRRSVRNRVEAQLAYLINEIQTGPYFFQTKNLDLAHQLVDEIREEHRPKK